MWEVDGPAFLLAHRLLPPGGWILFDDLTWSIADSPTMRDSSRYQGLPREYREAHHVQDVFDLLVAPHPEYEEIHVTNGGTWGWARKRPEGWHDDGTPVLEDATALSRKVAHRTRQRLVPLVGRSRKKLTR